MEFFNNFVIPPSPGHLMLLRFLLVIANAILVPYLAIVFGATLLSVMLNAFDRDPKTPTGPNFGRLAKDVMRMAVPDHVVPLVLGVLPLVVLWMIYGQWFYQSNVSTMSLLPAGAIITALSFWPLQVYNSTLYPEGKNTAINFAIGGLGLTALAIGTYVLVAAVTRFNDPERWVFTWSTLRTLTSFNIIWKYIFFVMSGVAIAGVGILYFFFDWGGRKPEMTPEYATFAKNFGAGAGIAGLLALPLLGFFYLVTTPILARSVPVYVVAAAMLVVLFVVFVFLYYAILSKTPRFGRPSFLVLLLAFILIGVGDQMTLVNATQEHSAALITQWEEREALLAAEREAAHSASVAVDLAVGERVFNTLCVTCHRMDERLVGPPLNTVLPKYADADALAAFIRRPTRVDAEYPAMPAPALTLPEIKSVAAYLLGEGDDAAPDAQEQPIEEQPMEDTGTQGEH